MPDQGADGTPSVNRPRDSRLLPALVSAVVAALVLGPALGRGVVLAYDLAWSPDPRLTPFALGDEHPRAARGPERCSGRRPRLDHGGRAGPGRRAVRHPRARRGRRDAAGPVVAPGAGMAAMSVAAIFAIWNPFVLERLVVGQWTVLLGYAAAPHLLVTAQRVREGRAAVWAPAVGLSACGVGGANTLVIGALTVGGVLAAPRPRWAALGLAGAASLGVSAVWALPAVTAGVTSSTLGVTAFAARADTPLGVLGSLLSGGAFWNPASHPASREVLGPSPGRAGAERGGGCRLRPFGTGAQGASRAGSGGARAAAGVAQRPGPLRPVDRPGRPRPGWRGAPRCPEAAGPVGRGGLRRSGRAGPRPPSLARRGPGTGRPRGGAPDRPAALARVGRRGQGHRGRGSR